IAVALRYLACRNAAVAGHIFTPDPCHRKEILPIYLIPFPEILQVKPGSVSVATGIIMRFARFRSGPLAMVLWVCSGAILAQPGLEPGFPGKPVRFVVPSAPGGGLDILARMASGPLNERWGVPIIVDNRPGASGIVGTQIVAKAAPDGYTLGM